MQRNEMISLLRDDHLRSALHRETRGQKRKQKLERVLHLNLDHAAGTVGLARANRQVIGRSDPRCRGGHFCRIETYAGGEILDVRFCIGGPSFTPPDATVASDAGPASCFASCIGHEMIGVESSAEAHYAEDHEQPHWNHRSAL